ncbi:restriction endonuclease subunit S [Staphylococcus hominis]|uniref:restriction endonuclease subunit S n=1 Tax=Staphylococcus hominis TaxID=1290 RepID=UPI0021A54BA6|nr:restriction endonuclease subunit S [Staphylococcus hominis]MCT1483295.1 restriction endonuclease subunit S [Staphylococcus hominis]
MNGQQLKNSILQLAIKGKLVKQIEEEGNVNDIISDKSIDLSEIPFDIPSNWKWVKLEDISDYIKAGGDKPKNFSIEKDELYPYPIIANGKENDGIVGYTDDPKIFDHCVTISARGTIGYSSIRSYPFTPTVRLLVVKLKEQINIKYIQIALTSLLETGIGTSIKQLTIPMVKPKLIPLPPLKEQKRIVKKLEELLPKINQYEKLYKEVTELNKKFLADLKKSILQYATSGKLTTQIPSKITSHDLYKYSITKKEELIKQKLIKKTKNKKITVIPFDIPETWNWVRLGDIAHLKIGKTPKRSETNYWDSDIPWVSISDMVSDNFTNTTKENISKKALNEIFKSNLSPKGTLLMSFKLTIGKVSILDIDAVHNEAIVSIFPFIEHENTLRDYLFKTLPLLVNYADSKGAIKGKTLNSTSLNNLIIPLPPFEEQKQIINKLNTFEHLINSLNFS